MPGPVSDSYDPEFGTGANARDVEEAIRDVRKTITKELGPGLHNIVQVAQGDSGSDAYVMNWSERELRIIRFCLDRALESI